MILNAYSRLRIVVLIKLIVSKSMGFGGVMTLAVSDGCCDVVHDKAESREANCTTVPIVRTFNGALQRHQKHYRSFLSKE